MRFRVPLHHCQRPDPAPHTHSEIWRRAGGGCVLVWCGAVCPVSAILVWVNPKIYNTPFSMARSPGLESLGGGADTRDTDSSQTTKKKTLLLCIDLLCILRYEYLVLSTIYSC